jgi:DNA repair exonuclease SbcCD nuclease subunit
MKICILGDTHFGMRNDSPIFHELYKNFYQNTLFPHLAKNNIKDIFQLGDLFDRRKYINFHTLEQVKTYFFDALESQGITLHTLLGNHDVYWKNTLQVNSTSLVLGEYENVVVYDYPRVATFDGLNIDVIPWICESNEEEVRQFISRSTSEVCLGHFELIGFEMDKGNVCHEGFEPSMLSRYETVMTGHFHHPSSKGNIIYVGAPGEMTWADYKDQRGFYIYDTDTRELEFVPNPYTIFCKIFYNEEELNLSKATDESYMSQFKGKYVKVVVAKKTNTFLFETFMDNLIKAGPIDVSVVEDFTDVTNSDIIGEVDQADDTTTILDKYIDGIEVDLDKNKLKTILRDIYTEAMTIES